MKQFETIPTRTGDLWTACGYVQRLRSGSRILTEDDASPFNETETAVFLGGSGLNVRIQSLDAPTAPRGQFRAVSPRIFAGQLNSGWELRYGDNGSVELHDGTDIVATAPAGTVPETEIVCASAVADGGDGGGSFEVELGTGTGAVFLDFDAFTVPDRFVVTWDGVDVIDTGLRGTDGTYDGVPVICDGPGSGSISFDKATSTPTKATVTVITPFSGTGWEYTLGCPAGGPPPYTPSSLTDDGEFTLTATTYGADTYNSGTPFDLTARVELASIPSSAFPKASINPMAGTIPAQAFSATDRSHYAGDTDAAWLIEVAGDGSATIGDGTDVVATRAAASTLIHEAAGLYQTTTYGADTYNGGQPFEIVVEMQGAIGRSGHIFILVTESGGDVTTAGPFYARTLPSVVGTTYPFELAEINAEGLVINIWDGAVPWS